MGANPRIVPFLVVCWLFFCGLVMEWYAFETQFRLHDWKLISLASWGMGIERTQMPGESGDCCGDQFNPCLKPSVSASLVCKSTNLLEIDPPKSKRMTPSLSQFVGNFIYKEPPSVNIQQALRKHKVILNFPLLVRGLGGYCSHNLSGMIFNVFSQV